VTVPHAILGGPWREHSPDFRYAVVVGCEEIFFYDGGRAVLHGDRWQVTEDGPLGEARSFVAATGTGA